MLVATDIAARGIDVTGVSHVFNFEMPNVAEQYVHRIGRTARAGADGIAISYVAPDERDYLRDIERLTKVKLFPQPLPADFLKEAARLPAPVRKPQELEQDARRDARDARGRGGPAARGQGGRSGGPNKNPQHRWPGPRRPVARPVCPQRPDRGGSQCWPQRRAAARPGVQPARRCSPGRQPAARGTQWWR